MTEASQDFAADPCSLAKRGAMVRAARALLSAVTRLMILADMVDVHLLLKTLNLVNIFLCILLYLTNPKIRIKVTVLKLFSL